MNDLQNSAEIGGERPRNEATTKSLVGHRPPAVAVLSRARRQAVPRLFQQPVRTLTHLFI